MLRTVIFVRTIESFMFHGAMAFRADQRELHSSCSAPHSAFASARLMALRRLVVGRALFFQPASIFPDVWFTSMAGFLIHFSRCARRTTNGSHLRAKANDSRAVAVRVKILNFALCETHYQLNMQPTIAHSRAASVSELSQARVGGGGNRYVGW